MHVSFRQRYITLHVLCLLEKMDVIDIKKYLEVERNVYLSMKVVDRYEKW